MAYLLPFRVLPLPLRVPPALAFDAPPPPALPFLALPLDVPPEFAFVTVVVLVVVLGVVGVVPVLELLLVVVVVVLVTFAFPFVLSVVHPFSNAATASRAKRAKVLRIEFSPVIHLVDC
jgi:hypothetical protein